MAKWNVNVSFEQLPVQETKATNLEGAWWPVMGFVPNLKRPLVDTNWMGTVCDAAAERGARLAITPD